MMGITFVFYHGSMVVKFFEKVLFSFLCLFISMSAKADCLKQADNLFSQGKDYFSRSQYLLAVQQLSTFSLLGCSSERRDEARLRWAQALFELGEVQEGNLVLDKIPSSSRYSSTARVVRAWYQPDLVSSLDSNEQDRFAAWAQKTSSLAKIKEPWVAGTLSALIPGAGQVYNENYQSALFSFILNALFLSAAIELNNKDLHATAIASGVVFSVFYIGNISSSVQSSRAINARAQESREAELRRKQFPELSF